MQTLGSQLVNTKVSEKGRERLLLSLFLLITGHRKLLRVVGDSMLPALHEGDRVIYRKNPTRNLTLKKGLIIILKNPLEPSSLIIKRLHQDNSLGMDVRGDNKDSSIDSRTFGLVSHSNLHGVVEQIIPKFHSN